MNGPVRILVCICAFAGPAFATDFEAGKAVAVGAAESSAATACFRCHGLDGSGDAAAAFPRLAGQSAEYIYKSLKDYASGARPNEIMAPIAKALTEGEMRDVAAYYAAQSAPASGADEADPHLLERGGVLNAIGSPEQGLQGCMNCHGPSGAGLPPTYPALAGQNARYLKLQLQLWREGRRAGDPLGVMAGVARRLEERDLEALAAYFASIPVAGNAP